MAQNCKYGPNPAFLKTADRLIEVWRCAMISHSIESRASHAIPFSFHRNFGQPPAHRNPRAARYRGWHRERTDAELSDRDRTESNPHRSDSLCHAVRL